MSHPSLLPADPSPIPSVRSFGRHTSCSHETTSPQERATTITTTALAQPATAELSLSDRIPSPFAKEDRVVFDLARLTRLPEKDGGSRDRGDFSQHVISLMDSPVSLSPHLHSLTPSLGRPPPSPLAKLTRPLSTGSTGYSLSQSPNQFASSEKPERVHTGAAFGTCSPTWRPLYQRTRSQGDIRVSVRWDREEDTIHNSSEASELSSNVRQEPISKDKRNRSLSRIGKGRVEKRIEATLAEAEPGANARSRKSSHILGLFKENTTSKDIRRGQDKSKSSPEIFRDDLLVERSGLDRNNTSQNGFDGYSSPNFENDTESALIGSSALGCTQNPDVAGGIVSVCPMGKTNRKSSTGAVTSKSLSNISGHLQDSSNNGLFKLTLLQADSPSEHGDLPYSNTPTRSLEDQHSLATLACAKSRSRQNITTSADTCEEDSAALCNECEALTYPLNDSNASHLAEMEIAERLEEYDEESEQISSALYFPHQGPSPDPLEEVNIGKICQCEDSPDDAEPPESAALSTQSLDSENGSENVDITLQSRNSSRYLHGDLHNSWILPKEPPFAKRVEIGISSASESEYESFDDSARSAAGEYSSLTDEAETTPNATPIIPNPPPKARARKSRRPPTAPVGAVELKPYSHQVGGHTTVFRFSKRAICKQLSNRENEFYEVVEREHPELLKFLPRYDFAMFSLVSHQHQGSEAEYQPSYRSFHNTIWLRIKHTLTHAGLSCTGISVFSM